MNSQKILIIKTGFTEFLTSEQSGTVSLGDVYRTTCILYALKDYHVTWLTADSAVELLPGAPLIDQTVVYSPETLSELLNTQFDFVLNLERCPELRRWANEFEKTQNAEVREVRIPLTLSPVQNGGLTRFINEARQPVVLNISIDSDLLMTSDGGLASSNGNGSHHFPYPFQAYIYQALGFIWDGEQYAVPKGVDASLPATLDVGFNYSVGTKWPVKAWPDDHWTKLAKLCDSKGISYSYQEGFDNLKTYTSWLQKHRVVISNDSLGLHLGLGLRRAVIGLFGPTRAGDLHFYNRGEALHVTTDCPKVPCFQKHCDYYVHCMETISPENVFSRLTHYLSRVDRREQELSIG